LINQSVEDTVRQALASSNIRDANASGSISGVCAPSVYLQSMSNGRFISVELGYPGANYGMLRARATKVGSWEMFRSVPHNDWACLQSVANNRYVSAEFGYRGIT